MVLQSFSKVSEVIETASMDSYSDTNMELAELDNGLTTMADLQGLSPFVSAHWCLTYLHTFSAKGGLISVDRLRSICSKLN